MEEFKINEYITLKLEDGRTNIYAGGKLFNHCKYVLLRKTVYELEDFVENIESVDEMAEYLDHSDHSPRDIPPDTKFWVHCSNMQVWAENNYDTRLLHRNLAFPLLKKLTQIGDLLAKRVFKDEIAKRFESGHPSVIEFLIRERYLDYLNAEEIKTLFQDLDLELIMKKNPSTLIVLYNFSTRLGTLRTKIYKVLSNFRFYDYFIIKELIWSGYIHDLTRNEINNLFKNFDYGLILREDPKYGHQVFKYLIRLKAPKAKNFYRDWVFEKFESGNNSEIAFLIQHGQLHFLDREDLLMLFDMVDYNYIMKHKEVLNLFSHLRYLGAPNIEGKYKKVVTNLIVNSDDLHKTVVRIIRGLLDKYDIEFINTLLSGFDYEHIAEQCPDIAPKFLEKLIKLGIQEAKEFYESENFLKKILIDNEIPFFLDLCSRLKPPIHIHQPNLTQRRTPSPLPPRITIVNKRIVEINLKGCNLNEIPDSIGKLTQLQKINLLKNRLNSLPSSMSNLKLLKELELSHNQFDEFPSVISQLKSLEELRLKRNSIEEVLDTLSELSSLRLLNLRRNNLKILPKSLSSLKNLVFLDLSFNNLDSIPENINRLESLEIFGCDNNNLKVLPETIGNLMKLKELHMDGNPLTSLPESILKIDSLEMLSVNLKHLNESGHSIINLLSDNNVSICSPPYTIDFNLSDDVYCFSPKDENTYKKFSRFINPERLPLTSSIVDKLDALYLMFKSSRKNIETPEFCTTVFETFEEVKTQLNPNFKVIFNEYPKTIFLKIMNKEPVNYKEIFLNIMNKKRLNKS